MVFFHNCSIILHFNWQQSPQQSQPIFKALKLCGSFSQIQLWSAIWELSITTILPHATLDLSPFYTLLEGCLLTIWTKSSSSANWLLVLMVNFTIKAQLVQECLLNINFIDVSVSVSVFVLFQIKTKMRRASNIRKLLPFSTYVKVIVTDWWSYTYIKNKSNL